MPILFFDTETHSMKKPRLVELAYSLRTPEPIMTTMRVKPPEPIDFGAMSAHHITNDMVASSPPFDPEALTPYDCTLRELFANNIAVAHNVSFDAEVMEGEGIKLGHTICTKKVAAHIYDSDSYSQQYLRYSLGVNTEEMSRHNNPHSATFDVEVLIALFDKLLASLWDNFPGEDEKTVILEMINITRRPMKMRRFPFGKHRGKYLQDIYERDPSYIEWMLGTDIDEDLRFNLLQLGK